MNFREWDLSTTLGLPPNFPRVDYNITRDSIDNIPRGCRRSNCERFYLEFLEVGRGPRQLQQYPNYAYIKIDFARNFGEYEGVGIFILPDLDGSVPVDGVDFSEHIPGKMVVVPLPYTQVSGASVRAFQFSTPSRSDSMPLGGLLSSMTRTGMQHFDFCQSGGRNSLLRGCRDFVFQMLIHMMLSGHIDGGARTIWPASRYGLPDVKGVSDTMGKQFGPGMDAENLIRRGRFRNFQRKVATSSKYEPEL
ncbi:uncharacterized protein GGS22DRAFT_184908 [Annulohypoxylon maeteangense]|uniref:uncharacterized protein n=1 Tax=Annulohypoxylon maeteangense TaxID=1927788 RepID=UPI002007AD05|nr:uncharacterized protein GGS22DRAFT_184908 [Annulohypoxylon maeteangense]KAI0889330.1 hypothetical protein GGS22DRAFT_184908 [Annulohypoxylon maeteangense]